MILLLLSCHLIYHPPLFELQACLSRQPFTMDEGYDTANKTDQVEVNCLKTSDLGGSWAAS